MAENYTLTSGGREPAEWLEALGGTRPSLIPVWPGTPRLAVVMAAVRREPDGILVYDEVVLLCTRAALEAAASPCERMRGKLFFQVPRDRLLKAVPGIDPKDFED
jgi:hypothetical protein